MMNGDPAPVEAVMDLAVRDIDRLVMADDVAYIGNWWPGQYYESPSPPGEPLFESVDDIPAWLIEEIDARYGNLFGTTQTGFSYGWWGYPRVGDFVLFNTDAGVAGMTTNLQETGVDEADLIETDGDYLYVISGHDLVIVDSRDPENLSIASRVQLAGRPVGIYLSEGRLTIISSNDWWNPIGRGPLMVFGDYQPTYSHRPTTTVTVLDVTDPAAPTQVQKTEMSGSLVSSRMVDGQLRIVVQQQSTHLTDHLPRIKFDTIFNQETQQYSYSYESRDSYLDRVRNTLRDSLIPHYQTFGVNGEVINRERLVSLDKILNPAGNRGITSTTVAIFDTHGNANGPIATQTVHTTDYATVYASKDNLYILGHDAQAANNWNETTIWKFNFDDEGEPIKLAAKGSVMGRLLNQFAVDEHNGYLRVVTGGFGSQALSVLEQDGDELSIVGQVTGIAPGEAVYSVRFADNRAYVVTFRRVDPLFVIDLTEPTNPVVQGELKIPGFTDYLHFLDDNHLIGVGRGADENTGLFEELQISIFRVTNPESPELLHRFSFGGDRWTTTPVTGGQWATGDGDHHAFNYFGEDGVLALPVNNLDGKNGLQVFRVDLTTGFEALTLIEHDTPILRSLKLGDKLVAISAGMITVHNMADPAEAVEELEIPSSESTVFTNFSQIGSFRALREDYWISGLAMSSVVPSSIVDRVWDESVVVPTEYRQDFMPLAEILDFSRDSAMESEAGFNIATGEESLEEDAWDLALELADII